MTSADGTIMGTTQILDNGSPARRFNLVLISDGYQNSQISKFANDTQSFIDALFAVTPFSEMKRRFNIYRVDVTSTDSGADDPTACGGTGRTADTYFDSSFCHDGVRRALECDVDSVRSVVTSMVPNWAQILVLVNSDVYGGTGGRIAVSSVGGNWRETALHEFGHAAFGLADEYEYYLGCQGDPQVDPPGTHDHHLPNELKQPNVTVNSNPSTIKWADLLTPGTHIPTMSDPNCAQCDRRPSPVLAGTVGAFEGAHYYHCGCFRPEYDCRMRHLGAAYCAVCLRVIRHRMELFRDR